VWQPSFFVLENPYWNSKQEVPMALAAHLKELNNKHEKLDHKIESELKHPAPDAMLLTKLKKQKLHLKQMISELQSG